MKTSFFVPGVPVPKGSAKAFMRKGMRFPVVIQDNADKQKPWASLIAFSAQQQCKAPVAGPVELEVTFWMPRPKAHFRKDGSLKVADNRHTKKPDTDKLLRCLKDALTGVAWNDDSQVDTVRAFKRYAGISKPGADIHITQSSGIPT